MPLLTLTGSVMLSMVGNQAVKIANISTALERRADDLRTWKVRLRRPSVHYNKKWKILPGNMDLKVKLIILEFLRQWAELAIGNYNGERKPFAILLLTSQELLGELR